MTHARRLGAALLAAACALAAGGCDGMLLRPGARAVDRKGSLPTETAGPADRAGTGGVFCPQVQAHELRAPDFARLCADASTIPEAWACDGFPDCPRGEDEGPWVHCPGFRCGDGSYVPAAWVGDGDADCPGAEDEDA